MEYKKDYGQRLTTRINHEGFLILAANLSKQVEPAQIMLRKSLLTIATVMVIFVLSAMLVILGNSQDAVAKKKKVGNKTAASLYQNCLLASDSKERKSRNKLYDWCCSESLGYCIQCPTIGSARCSKVTWSKRPSYLWGQQAPVGGVMAPTKDKPKKTLPSTTGTIMNTVPMKQYKMAPMKPK